MAEDKLKRKDVLVLIAILAGILILLAAFVKPLSVLGVDYTFTSDGKRANDFSLQNPVTVNFWLEKPAKFFSDIRFPVEIQSTGRTDVECAPIIEDRLGNLGNCQAGGYRDVYILPNNCPSQGKVACIRDTILEPETVVVEIGLGEGKSVEIYRWDVTGNKPTETINIANIINNRCYGQILEGIQTGGQGTKCTFAIQAKSSNSKGLILFGGDRGNPKIAEEFNSNCDYKPYADSASECNPTLLVQKPIVAPLKPTISTITLKLADIFKSILAQIKELFGLTIIQAGETAHNGDTIRHVFDLRNTKTYALPDSDFEDGAVSYTFVSWAVIDTAGNIVKQGDVFEIPPLEAGQNIPLQVSYNIENLNTGKYYVIALLTNFPQTYNQASDSWQDSASEIIDKQAISFSVAKVPTPAPPSKTIVVGKFQGLFQSLLDFLRRLFGF